MPRTGAVRSWSTRRIVGRVVRSPVVVWPLALAAGAGAAAQVQAARQAEQRWGRAVPVVVTARTLTAGHRVRPVDLRIVRYPQPLSPRGSARSTDALVGRVIAAPVMSGEPLLAARLAATSETATQVAIGPHRRAVTLAAEAATPALTVGDVVDLVAARGPADGPGPEGVVAAAAAVLRVDERRVTVTVHVDEVRAVTRAVVSGPVLLVLRGT